MTATFRTADQQAALSSTGDFDSAALASGRRFYASEFVSNAPILGLEREAGYIWGSLRDDDGNLYSIMRRISASPPVPGEGHSLGGKLILVSSGTGGDGLRLRKEPRHAVDSVHVQRSLLDESAAVLSSISGAAGAPMRLVLSQDDFSYLEDGVIDVTGTLAVPPLQWYLPGPESSLLYLTHTWMVEGTLVGKQVRGFLFWEEAWMPPGGRLYVTHDPLREADYLTWYSWANHYEDGSCEVGHFLFGRRDFHVGVIGHSDGTTSSAQSMDAVITRAADGHWHDGIAYRIDGVDWVCEPDAQGRMLGLGPMPNPQQEGRIHRVDDTRMPDVYMAWGESVPAAGERR